MMLYTCTCAQLIRHWLKVTRAIQTAVSSATELSDSGSSVGHHHHHHHHHVRLLKTMTNRIVTTGKTKVVTIIDSFTGEMTIYFIITSPTHFRCVHCSENSSSTAVLLPAYPVYTLCSEKNTHSCFQ